jgi:hypothetical protein
MTFKTLFLGLCAMVLLVSGCAETLDHFHKGNKIKERHYVPGTWGIPGEVAWTECREDQMKWSEFWKKKVCNDTIDPNATLAVDGGVRQTASYKDLVVPATINGLFSVAAFGTLGALIPETNVRQVNNISGSPVRTSTLLINAPVPGGVAP